LNLNDVEKTHLIIYVHLLFRVKNPPRVHIILQDCRVRTKCGMLTFFRVIQPQRY